MAGHWFTAEVQEPPPSSNWKEKKHEKRKKGRR
jgi:hypothetical protein